MRLPWQARSSTLNRVCLQATVGGATGDDLRRVQAGGRRRRKNVAPAEAASRHSPGQPAPFCRQPASCPGQVSRYLPVVCVRSEASAAKLSHHDRDSRPTLHPRLDARHPDARHPDPRHPDPRPSTLDPRRPPLHAQQRPPSAAPPQPAPVALAAPRCAGSVTIDRVHPRRPPHPPHASLVPALPTSIASVHVNGPASPVCLSIRWQPGWDEHA